MKVNVARLIARRLVVTVPLLMAVGLATFLILHATPGDPARALLGIHATPELVAETRQRLGLDRNVFVQYWKFIGNSVGGDLGTSIRTRQPVSTIVMDRWSVTALIASIGSLFSLLIAVPAASIAAARKGGVIDRIVRGSATVALGMPSFWVGIMLVLLIAIPTGWFPVGGQFGETFGEHLRAVFLPSLALGITLAPILIRSLRSAMVAVLDSEYISAARSVGVKGRRLLIHHVMRNALVPLISLFAVVFSYVLVSTVLLEQAFGLTGLGSSMVEAAGNRDYPVVLGLTLVFGVAVVLVHLVADVLIVIADPRVEVG